MEKGKRNKPSGKAATKEQKGTAGKKKAANVRLNRSDAGWRNLVNRLEAKTPGEETNEEKFSRLSGLW